MKNQARYTITRRLRDIAHVQKRGAPGEELFVRARDVDALIKLLRKFRSDNKKEVE